jgi:putative spermidine/putrescine transport system substrate-binding protein
MRRSFLPPDTDARARSSRRRFGTLTTGALLGAAVVLAATGCGAPDSGSSEPKANSSVPDKPRQAVTLNVLDVAGNLQLTQGMLDDFTKTHSDIVSNVVTTKATVPELAGKIKAQQDAGRLDIDLVLTGTDGLSAGIEQNLWQKLVPDFNDRLASSMKNYLEPAAKMQELAQGYGVALVYYPSGPLIEYNPKTVPTPPATAEELLTWAKAHPGKFQYAVPKNSGPGRTFLMGLPYLLGDSNPKDPDHGWDKTWRYLTDLGSTVQYYPSGTTETMKNLANGTADIVVSTTGWDINPRVLGTVPKDMKIGTLQGFHWVTDAQYAVVPKGADSNKLSAILQLLAFMLTPKEQAIAYDKGYFYPGPAIKDVPLTMAPADSQKAIADFGRPEYDALINNNPKETSLPPAQQVAAFDTWDRTVAGSKGKK